MVFADVYGACKFVQIRVWLCDFVSESEIDCIYNLFHLRTHVHKRINEYVYICVLVYAQSMSASLKA